MELPVNPPNQRKKNGDVFEIPLHPYLDQFAYVKYINILKYNKRASYPDIVRVYNFFSDKPIDSVQDIPICDLLINPMYITGGYGMMKLYRRVGWNTVLPEEENSPAIRLSVPHYAEERGIPATGWNVISPDYTKLNSDQLPFEAVQHLDCPGLIISVGYIGFRIAAELYKLESKDISDEFELDWYQKIIWNRSKAMPPLQKIPEGKRFRI